MPGAQLSTGLDETMDATMSGEGAAVGLGSVSARTPTYATAAAASKAR